MAKMSSAELKVFIQIKDCTKELFWMWCWKKQQISWKVQRGCSSFLRLWNPNVNFFTEGRMLDSSNIETACGRDFSAGINERLKRYCLIEREPIPAEFAKMERVVQLPASDPFQVEQHRWWAPPKSSGHSFPLPFALRGRAQWEALQGNPWRGTSQWSSERALIHTLVDTRQWSLFAND